MRYHTIQLPTGQQIRVELPTPQNFPIDSQGVTWDGRQLKPLEPITDDDPRSGFRFWLKLFKRRLECANEPKQLSLPF